jgi:hypothetical protein
VILVLGIEIQQVSAQAFSNYFETTKFSSRPIKSKIFKSDYFAKDFNISIFGFNIIRTFETLKYFKIYDFYF